MQIERKGRIYKSVYVRVFHDSELLRYVLRCYVMWDMFFVVRSNDSFNFPLGWIKSVVIAIVVVLGRNKQLVNAVNIIIIIIIQGWGEALIKQ